MSVYVSIEVNDAEARAYFEYAGQHARDMRTPLRRIAFDVIAEGIIQQFETQGERSGGWRPLNPLYLARKTREGWDPRILFRTHDMFVEATLPSAWKITKDRLTYSPDTGYKGELHQQGGSTPGRPPKRPWLVVTPEDYAQMEHIWRDWLDELRVDNARRHGFAPTPGLPNINFPFGSG